MPSIRGISPCLWFDTEAEQAAKFYCGIFENSQITKITRYTKVGYETHHHAAGSVMTVVFDLDGNEFTALNGGPEFKFNEAISLQVFCESQDDIDFYWDKLSAGGDPEAQVCGWLKDKYGLSWQVVPEHMADYFSDEDTEAAGRTMEAMMKMKKIDIAELERAYEGETHDARV